MDEQKQIEGRLRARTDVIESRQHAQWAGMALAEVLTNRRQKLTKLTRTDLERYRRAYGVQRFQMRTFKKACQEALPTEKVWQTAAA